MKKILIAYASKSGTVRTCAEKLAKELDGYSIDIVDLNENMPKDIDGYDFVAVGSSVRMGKLQPHAASFIDRFEPTLKKMRAGYFICCGFTDSADEYFSKNISSELLDRAVAYECFGGELDPKKHKGFDRFVVRAVKNSVLDEGAHDGEMRTANLPAIEPESISRFASYVRRSFVK
jgi:menaquinone-dependent protoporphyrinogen oxidase